MHDLGLNAVGEPIWYVAGGDELAHIEHYIPAYQEFSDDAKTLAGAYGARISPPRPGAGTGPFDDEWNRVIAPLKQKDRVGSRNCRDPANGVAGSTMLLCFKAALCDLVDLECH